MECTLTAMVVPLEFDAVARVVHATRRPLGELVLARAVAATAETP